VTLEGVTPKSGNKSGNNKWFHGSFQGPRERRGPFKVNKLVVARILTQKFFEQLIEAPVPLDLRAIKALKRSALSLDLYAWGTRRVSYLKRPLRISWASFQSSFGAGYAETPQGRSRFRGNAIEALHRVKAVYPQLRIEIRRDGVLLYPSMTHIPKSARA
jgi:hypothetical protein